MKETENTKYKFATAQGVYIVPEDFLNNLIERQDKIIDLLSGRSQPSLNGHLTEKQARELLNKKTTWFWQMRKDKKLQYKKIGKTIYYSVDDLNSLLENCTK